MASVRAGLEILELARSSGARSIFMVGTGRNVGKTTALRAIYEAAERARCRTGLASVGRDSEAHAQEAHFAKPRLWLERGTIFATSRGLLPAFPAAEILRLSSLRSAAGSMLYARVASPGFYELAGPPTASGVREVVEELLDRTDLAIVDGAVDRVSAVAGSDGAVVVAGGAAGALTVDDAVNDIAALVGKLQIPPFDSTAPAVDFEGALTAADATALIARSERRQVVVRDPTQFLLSGRPARQVLSALKVRCLRPLRVVAVTISSSGGERNFEPADFAEAVARATNLPTFDVYRNARAG